MKSVDPQNVALESLLNDRGQLQVEELSRGRTEIPF